MVFKRDSLLNRELPLLLWIMAIIIWVIMVGALFVYMANV